MSLRVYHSNTTLKAIIESTLAAPASKYLCLDYHVIAACDAVQHACLTLVQMDNYQSSSLRPRLPVVLSQRSHVERQRHTDEIRPLIQ